MHKDIQSDWILLSCLISMQLVVTLPPSCLVELQGMSFDWSSHSNELSSEYSTRLSMVH